MARIVARFNGKCSACGAALPKGSEIEYRDKRAFCLQCTSEEEERPGSEDGVTLAERLGYRKFTQEELDS